MKEALLLEARLIHNDKVISWKEIDDEIVLLHKGKKVFYEMNKTAKIIWKGVLKGEKVSSIIKAIAAAYKGTDKSVINRDVIDFINFSLKEKMFILKK